MEEKSIDELRREAQEKYQAKLQAYQQNKNVAAPVAENVKRQSKPATLVPPKVKIGSSFPKISLPAFKEAVSSPNQIEISFEQNQFPERQVERKNWFVVSVFSLLVLVVIMELFVF